ncbi:unnamed protein product [Prorocentrum cordatum]|uniref:Uncharacterized protein n=1 Tax=Prorocentrum cordatum TaxID=2364126 RepID=A0ABN9T7C0_9DINO|nr:unnamed protein product [Polarella glacialis]
MAAHADGQATPEEYFFGPGPDGMPRAVTAPAAPTASELHQALGRLSFSAAEERPRASLVATSAGRPRHPASSVGRGRPRRPDAPPAGRGPLPRAPSRPEGWTWPEQKPAEAGGQPAPHAPAGSTPASAGSAPGRGRGSGLPVPGSAALAPRAQGPQEGASASGAVGSGQCRGDCLDQRGWPALSGAAPGRARRRPRGRPGASAEGLLEVPRSPGQLALGGAAPGPAHGPAQGWPGTSSPEELLQASRSPGWPEGRAGDGAGRAQSPGWEAGSDGGGGGLLPSGALQSLSRTLLEDEDAEDGSPASPSQGAAPSARGRVSGPEAEEHQAAGSSTASPPGDTAVLSLIRGLQEAAEIDAALHIPTRPGSEDHPGHVGFQHGVLTSELQRR